jgi:exopolysaccharide biosynthesis WecB/TagA/CpsF family protein
MEPLIDILGVPVQSGDPAAVRDHIDDRIARKEPSRVAFLNAHLSNHATLDPELHDNLRSFLVLNDGLGIDLARQVLHGSRFRYNLNGTDFLPYLLSTTRHDLRLYLVGAQDQVVRMAAEAIERHWPRHKVVGFHDGYFDSTQEAPIRSEILETDPNVVLVAMGNPRQELWIAQNIPTLCNCGIGVGAWFDFLTGSVPRAPVWIRRARLEWIYRMSREPRRLFGRYFIGGMTFVACIATAPRPTRRATKR